MLGLAHSPHRLLPARWAAISGLYDNHFVLVVALKPQSLRRKKEQRGRAR